MIKVGGKMTIPTRGRPEMAGMYYRMMVESKHASVRQFSVFNEFSKQLKGETKSNPEFQQSVKELDKKIGAVKEDLKERTRKTTEKLYKTVGDVWSEAEVASKKVSATVKEKFSVAKEEVSATVKEKFSVAKEEVKATFKQGSERSSGSTSTSTCSSGVKSGNDAGFRDKNPQSSESTQSEEPSGHSQTDTLFGKFKSTLSSSPSLSLAFQKLRGAKISEIVKSGYDIVKDELSSKPTKKKFIDYQPNPISGVRSTKTDIVVTPSKQSPVSGKWEAFKNKVKVNPVFNRIRGYGQPVQEVMEDIKEKWDTSDHPAVHKIQDLNENIFGETFTALSSKEIQIRDPTFSLPEFVAEVQEIIKPVLTAYFKGDAETLKRYCCPEVLERSQAEKMGYESHGIFFDRKILHISEVNVIETKMSGSSPVIILSAETQQIVCVRDKEGSITEGGKDTIQTLFYAMAMQQIDNGEGYHVWKLRELQQAGGFQSLI